MTKSEKGLTAEKDEFSDWFTQLMLKADLADYSAVSGALIFKPKAYAIWEILKALIDARFKRMGVENVYFPLFIPESLLKKEQEHLEGFTPEVAWVTHTGDTKLSERLAVRPTSEAIMYASYSKWIRSWRDLPLLYNQWNNVVRWEFRHPVPFLRTREFLWNEGHSVYATKAEAEKEGSRVLKVYADVCEKFMALPFLVGRKTEKEKFAGAEYTVSMEFYLPNGKAIQGPDFHHDADRFAKAYDITYLDKEGKKQYVHQNTYAFTTRQLGIMFAVHSDSRGLVIPPNVAPVKAVVIPILFEDSKEKVLKKARELGAKLRKYNVTVDDREEYKPGFKMNEWDLKGIPLKIEIGPKDIANQEVVVSRRDTGKKDSVKLKALDPYVRKTLSDIQDKLFEKARNMLYDNIVETQSFAGLQKSLNDKKIALCPMCKAVECEDTLKHKTGGAKTLNIPYKQPAWIKDAECVICGRKADYAVYVGKSY